MSEGKHTCAGCFTPEAIEQANAHVANLQANLDITNADHIALWLEESLNDDTGLGWLACRIVEAHERSTQTSANRITSLEDEIARLKSENYKSFTDGMEAAAQICGSLAETTYDDADEFRVAAGCEAAIMGVVRQQRDEQAPAAARRPQAGAAIMDDLIERLRAREAKHREAIANSQIVVDLLAPQMALFEARDVHNIYAVRLCVDHQSSIRTTTKEADELADAVSRITSLQQALERIARGKYDGLEVHHYPANICRDIARAALRGEG